MMWNIRTALTAAEINRYAMNAVRVDHGKVFDLMQCPKATHFARWMHELNAHAQISSPFTLIKVSVEMLSHMLH